MANPLTGDHDVIMQVSVGTLNRLLASMHQNDDTATILPTLPHGAFVRVGDDPATRVDGVHGVARVQAGVPQLQLLHLSQDRVAIRVPVRAWFTASSGCASFPEFVHGTVRAEYGLLELPGFTGTSGFPLPPPRFKFDVDPATVSFTSLGDTSHDAAIARQIVGLLGGVFAMPGGHPVIQPLMERKLLSLAAGGSEAVVIALELGPDPASTQQPGGVTNILTAGKDFAIAVSSDFILSLLRPQLAVLEATTTTVQADVLLDTAVYTIDITSATVGWALDTAPLGATLVPCGALDLTIQGTGRTTSIFPDGSFTIRQRLLLGFNPASQFMFLVQRTPSVTASVGGIAAIESVVESEIKAIYEAQMTAALTAAAPSLLNASAIKEVIAVQLQVSDEQAKTTLDSAEFTLDGIVMRGSVSLAPRRRPTVQFGPLPDESGYSAFLSWFPGGRIVAFGWKWIPLPRVPGESDDPQRQVHEDRFVVQPDVEMPGLPAPSGGPLRGGRVCVDLAGLVIDPVTGAEVPAFASDCISVELLPPGWLPDVVNLPLWWPLWNEIDVGVVEAGRGCGGAEPFNTLLYHTPDLNDAPSLAAVAAGIEGTGRDDAGLLLLTLVPKGRLEVDAPTRLRTAISPRDVAVRVAEDTSGVWARAFGVEGYQGEAFRLVTADGRLAWSHDGPIEPEELRAALREHLVPSEVPQFVALRPEARIGVSAPPAYLPVSPGERVSLVQLRGRSVTLCFALTWADSSLAQVRYLNAEGSGGFVAVVLTGATGAEATAFARAEAPELLVMADQDRAITSAFGVHVWPTTVTIDEAGILASVTSGMHPADEPAKAGA